MRLLIAVLSPSTARRIAAGMEIRGFDALIAPNGTQALKLLSRERFDLLILHACLPELDGFEVLESLAALHQPLSASGAVFVRTGAVRFPAGPGRRGRAHLRRAGKAVRAAGNAGAKAAAKTGSGSGAAHRAGGGYLFKRHFHGPSLQGPRLCGVAP